MGVLQDQLRTGSVPNGWTRLDASAPSDMVLLLARSVLGQCSELTAL
jgi:hypothetical protein